MNNKFYFHLGLQWPLMVVRITNPSFALYENSHNFDGLFFNSYIIPFELEIKSIISSINGSLLVHGSRGINVFVFLESFFYDAFLLFQQSLRGKQIKFLIILF